VPTPTDGMWHCVHGMALCGLQVLDEDCSLQIERDELESLLSYAALDLQPGERADIISTYDLNGDGTLSRIQFCEMCMGELWDVPIAQLERAVKSMQSVKSGAKRRAKAYWSRLAAKTDDWSRIVVPVLYIIALVVVFNLELTDDYGSARSATMFQGLGPARITSEGWKFILYICAYFAFSFGMWALASTFLGARARRMFDQTLEQNKRHFSLVYGAERPDVSERSSPHSPSISKNSAGSRIGFRRTSIGVGLARTVSASADADFDAGIAHNAVQQPGPAPSGATASGGTYMHEVEARIVASPRKDADSA